MPAMPAGCMPLFCGSPPDGSGDRLHLSQSNISLVAPEMTLLFAIDADSPRSKHMSPEKTYFPWLDRSRNAGEAAGALSLEKQQSRNETARSAESRENLIMEFLIFSDAPEKMNVLVEKTQSPRAVKSITLLDADPSEMNVLSCTLKLSHFNSIPIAPFVNEQLSKMTGRQPARTGGKIFNK